MILVVDAYNVLKSSGSIKHIDEAERERFIKLLGKYGKRKEHMVVAVFDGGHYMHSFRCHRYGVTVIYSGTKESADTYIKRYLKENRARDLLLISSDRELASLASQLGIVSMNAIEFYALLRQEMTSVTPKPFNQRAVKTAVDDQPDLDMLMYESRMPRAKAEDEQIIQHNVSKAQTLSKKERAMMKKLKKL